MTRASVMRFSPSFSPKPSSRRTVIADENDPPQGISTLIDAAVSVASNKESSQVGVMLDQEQQAGILTLLEAASTMKSPPRMRHNKELPRLPAFPLFQPSKEEIASATTMRRRYALESWYKRLHELADYKERHGDCMVPQKFNPNLALGSWVNKQRMEKKFLDRGLKTSLTPYRVGLLNQLGFHWAKEKGQVSWDQKYAELKAFHQRHGHANVPTKYAENSALGRWVSTQRAQAKELQQGRPTKMTQQRFDLLAALEFQFDRIS